MKGYEAYILTLCLIVFVLLTVFFGVLISLVIKMRLKIVTGGLADGELIKRKQKQSIRKKSVAYFVTDVLLPAIVLVAIITVFVFSLILKVNEKKVVGNVPVLKVVTSESMARKNEKNEYLKTNDLNNQLQKFDLIVVSALPKEEELKLYDVVVYEVEGILLVHRIVEIQEPDASRSERYFRLQGDAIQYADRFPVKYSQMKGIYDGKRTAYIGSFVVFMQSPAGYVCVMLVAFTCAVYPFIENKMNKTEKARMAEIEGKPEGD